MTSNELEIFKQSILDDVRVMMQTTGQVTQYIGARYVPLFAEPLDWSAEREYEPLTIVLNQGNSYTSRQFVPKGIGIDNNEFWANTGNYNAQIEQYRKELNALKKKVDAFDDVVTPEQFGAIGDSASDDTDAVIAALNSGKKVLLVGKYKCTRSISLANAAQLSIEGLNVNTSGFKFTNGASMIIGKDSNVNELRFTNFAIVGDRSQNTLLTIRNVTNIYMQSVNFAESSEWLIALDKCGIVFFNECIFAGSNERDVFLPCNGIICKNGTTPIYVTGCNIWNMKVFIKLSQSSRAAIINDNWIETVGTLIDMSDMAVNGALLSCCRNNYYYTIYNNIEYGSFSTIKLSNITNVYDCNVIFKENFITFDPSNHIKSFIDIVNVSAPINVNFQDNITFSTMKSASLYACTVDDNNSLLLKYSTPNHSDIDMGCENPILVEKISYRQNNQPTLNIQAPTELSEEFFTNGNIWLKDWLYIKKNNKVHSIPISNAESIAKLSTSASTQDIVDKFNILLDIISRTHLIRIS